MINSDKISICNDVHILIIKNYDNTTFIRFNDIKDIQVIDKGKIHYSRNWVIQIIDYHNNVIEISGYDNRNDCESDALELISKIYSYQEMKTNN